MCGYEFAQLLNRIIKFVELNSTVVIRWNGIYDWMRLVQRLEQIGADNWVRMNVIKRQLTINSFCLPCKSHRRQHCIDDLTYHFYGLSFS